MSRRWRWTTAAAALLVVAGVATALSSGSDPADASPQPPRATGTATVARGDLVVTETIDGTLGYASSSSIQGRRGGTITRLAAEGSVVRRGQPLYSVDGQPVHLLYGKLPAYRTLGVGTKGADVRQLERNLEALGYGEGLDVDGTYSSRTAEKVREWQEDLGLPETGRLELGSVVFRPGAFRVAEHEVDLGSTTGPGQAVLTGSGLERVVTVDLPVGQRSLARPSAPVTVTLPDGTTVEGTVTSVGTVAETDADDGDQGQGDGEATVEVTVTLTDPEAAGGLDAAPVSVTFESERRDDVLSVPVNALLALPSGGYGVSVVDGRQARTVEVELGVFADGRVEVSGDGLQEGMDVEVPAS